MSTPGDDSQLPNEPAEPSQPTQPTQPPGEFAAPSPYGAPGAPPVMAGESISFAGSAAGTEPLVPATPPRRSRKVPIIAGATVLVLIAGGGAAYAVSSFLSGGGAQPESVVPANAIAYADVDLDPSAGQKIAAYRFLHKFPSTDHTSSDGDLVGQVVKSLLKSDSSTKVDYDTDIKPWLGSRAAIAAVPSAADASPKPLVVIQVKDEGKARTSLRKLLDEDSANAFASDGDSYSSDGSLDSSTDEPEGLVVRDGYALVGEDQASVEALSASAQKADLGSSTQFVDDMKKAGDSGVASAWVDVDAVTKTAGGEWLTGAAATGNITQGGRAVAVLRFDGNALELTAKQFGGTAPAGKGGHPGGPMLQTLPADTTGAFAVGNMADVIDHAWTAAQKASTQFGGGDLAKQAKKSFGVNLPDDLNRLLGTGIAVAVGDVSSDDPQIGVKVRTTDPAGSQDVLDTVLGDIREESGGLLEIPPIAHATSPDGIVYASTPEYASTLAAAGTLGSSPAFQEAVPDAATATSAAYIDFVKVAAQNADDPDVKDLAPLKSFGMVVHNSGGESTMTMRLVTR